MAKKPKDPTAHWAIKPYETKHVTPEKFPAYFNQPRVDPWAKERAADELRRRQVGSARDTNRKKEDALKQLRADQDKLALELAILIWEQEPRAQLDLAAEISSSWKDTATPAPPIRILVQMISEWQKDGKLPRLRTAQ